MKRFLNLLRPLLLPFSALYFILHLIDRKYKHCIQKRAKNAFVISIGNITTGGTGKTPFTVFLTNELSCFSPTIVTRGYHSGLTGKVINLKNPALLRDEPGLLASRTGCDVSVHPNRYQAILQSGKKGSRNIKKALYIMDDGFQHYQLDRDLDIVLIDSTNPFGNGLLFPAGDLREPVTSLRRANFIILTRSESVSFDERNKIICKLQDIGVAKKNVFLGQTIIEGIFDQFGKKISLLQARKLQKEKIFAFAGIGNFNSFTKTIISLFQTEENIKFHRFSDHRKYKKKEIDFLKTAIKEGYHLLTTKKDINKLPVKNFPCYSVRISTQILNKKNFMRQIRKAISFPFLEQSVN